MFINLTCINQTPVYSKHKRRLGFTVLFARLNTAHDIAM